MPTKRGKQKKRKETEKHTANQRRIQKLHIYHVQELPSHEYYKKKILKKE